LASTSTVHLCARYNLWTDTIDHNIYIGLTAPADRVQHVLHGNEKVLVGWCNVSIC
jgi:hypothetical protein